VTLVPESSPAGSAVTDPFSFAFQIATTNSQRKVVATQPAVRLDFDGHVMSTSQIVETEAGLLASGQKKLPLVSFWDAGTVVPGPDLAFYPTGNESYLVINTDAEKVTKINFELVDMHKDTDRLYVIDGDSLESSRVCASS